MLDGSYAVLIFWMLKLYRGESLYRLHPHHEEVVTLVDELFEMALRCLLLDVAR